MRFGTRSLAAALLLGLAVWEAAAQESTESSRRIDVARAYADEHPEDDGLMPFVEALAAASDIWGDYLLNFSSLLDIIENGWRGAGREPVAALIRSNQTALARLGEASQANRLVVPDSVIDTPSARSDPRYGALELLRLTLADARRLQARGEADAAAERVLQTVRLAHLLLDLDPENSDLMRALGTTEMRLALRTLASTLRHRAMSPEMVDAIRDELSRMRESEVTYVDAYRAGVRSRLALFRQARSDPDVRARLLSEGEEMLAHVREASGEFQREMAEASDRAERARAVLAPAGRQVSLRSENPPEAEGWRLLFSVFSERASVFTSWPEVLDETLQNLDAVEADAERVLDAMAVELAKPPTQQQTLSRGWLEARTRWRRIQSWFKDEALTERGVALIQEIEAHDYRPLQDFMRPFLHEMRELLMVTPNDLANLGTVNRTEMDLVLALCALRLEESTGVEEFDDPFSDGPLHLAEDRVWGVGPDGVDQRGALNYDPTNGVISPGDIVAWR